LVSVTRRVRFSAARRLARSDWSDLQNARVYGGSAELHGHDFALDVTLRGAVPDATGMVVDLKRLKQLVETRVVARLDRRDLTRSALLAGRVATMENLVLAIWRVLTQELDPELKLEEVRLHEGLQRSAMCRKED
jgi:6-pyruvoyltetrahydropterin/6-carboxytetrahydropterin synthase